jgi:hypothetical protein
MKNQTHERGFVAFIMALVVFVMIFVVVPAEATECTDAHVSACKDLVGAEITFEKVSNTKYKSVCGDNTRACATLNVTTKQCTIYYRTRMLEQEILNHEMNHCRGWFHRSDREVTYSRPWVDLNTYLGG